MSRRLKERTALTIPINETESNIHTFDKKAMPRGVAISAPAALTGTVTLYGYPLGSSTRRKIKSGGSAVTIAAGESEPLDAVLWERIQLVSSQAEVAAREFELDELLEW
jgi:hypothetical protein